MAATTVKEIMEKIAERTHDSLRRSLTTEGNKYSKATADETSAKDEKAEAHKNLQAIMKTLDSKEEVLKTLKLLLYDKGGKGDYELAKTLLTEEELASITKWVIDPAKAEEVLDAETLDKIKVPVISIADAKKHLKEKDTVIESITISGSAVETLNVIALRKPGEKARK